MSASNRQERLMWEEQIRQLDVIMRYMTEMRSTAARRVRRLSTTSGAVPGAPRRPPRQPMVNNLVGAQRNLMHQFYEEDAHEMPLVPVNVIPPEPPRPKRLLPPKRKVLAVKLAEQQMPMESVCAICHDTHTKLECATTDCKHEFGHACLSNWFNTQRDLQEPATCPTCRNLTREITTYRPRKVAERAPAPEPPPLPMDVEA